MVCVGPGRKTLESRTAGSRRSMQIYNATYSGGQTQENVIPLYQAKICVAVREVGVVFRVHQWEQQMPINDIKKKTDLISVDILMQL